MIQFFFLKIKNWCPPQLRSGGAWNYLMPELTSEPAGGESKKNISVERKIIINNSNTNDQFTVVSCGN
jgi:hypothetical protein